MVEALTKRKKSGELYTRPKEVERAIHSATKQSLAEIKRRSTVSDKASPDFLIDECIVHLVRRKNRENDTKTANALLSVLLTRCAKNLQSSIYQSLSEAEDIRQEILKELCDLFAADYAQEKVEELDYYECRFNSAFKTLRLMVLRKYQTNNVAMEALPDLDTYQGKDEGSDAVISKLIDMANQEDRVFLEQARKAIQDLPPDERKAFILCNVFEYKIESVDPKERTAASICNVTGKTIQNRLTRAKAKLQHFYKEL